MRIAGLLAHLVLAVGCGDQVSGLARGDTYLVIEAFSVQRYRVEVSGAGELTGELFGRSYKHSRDVVIPVRELGAARCPDPGKIALLKTTADLWDIGLTVGTDGERCYLQQQDKTSQREPLEVFELPMRVEPQVTALRAHFERRWERRTWVPRRPAGWTPMSGSDVVFARDESLGIAKVLEWRMGAVRLPLSPGRSGEPRDNWYSLRDVAPVPSSGVPPAVSERVR